MVSHKYYLLRKYTQHSPLPNTAEMGFLEAIFTWSARRDINNCFRVRYIEGKSRRNYQIACQVEELNRRSDLLMQYEIIVVVKENKIKDFE